MKKQPFVILFMGRSGSTWLTSLLNSHPQIKCRPEEFYLQSGHGKLAPNERTRLIGRFLKDPARTNPTPEQCLRRLNHIFNREGDACGFKFKYANQVQSYPEIMNALRERSDELKVIHLTRRNHLKRAISKQNLMRRVKSMKRVKTKMDAKAVAEQKLLTVDIPLLLSFMKRQRRQFDRLRLIVDEFPRVHQIDYESLLVDHERVMHDLLTFLEVDPAADLSADMVKATPDRLEDIVENYGEVALALKDTPYAHFLEAN